MPFGVRGKTAGGQRARHAAKCTSAPPGAESTSGGLIGCSSGFTLLEVMVAVAILGLVLVTLLGVKNRSMEDVLLADHMTTATLLAKRAMTELYESVQNQQQESEDEGEFPEEAFKDFTWKKSVAFIPFQFEDTSVTIAELRVQVLWNEGTHPEMVELVSYE
jgi:prepilin-type N-terminal cleavage/methylation domain-containing protein